ncbi:MAG TPA: S53 family serine peptidase [Pseudonocardiaceae bacterium]|jgi:subtilase family serine protease|nr:S53 family serine peptidase [Pseudonocardiaceae bacterium]
MTALPTVFMLIGSLLAAPATAATTSSQQVDLTVYIRQSNAADAVAYAEAVSDPRSPRYRHFLSPAQYRARFAPTDGTVAAVDDYLRGAGLTVENGPANHLFVRAHGSAPQVARAARAVPAAVAPLIAGSTAAHTGRLPSVLPATEPVVCSSYAFQHFATLPQAYGRTEFPTRGCGYTPQQMHDAYGTTGLLAHGIDGRGVRLAVLLFYPIPTVVADIDRFDANHGVPGLAPGQLTEVLPSSFVEPPPAACPLPDDQQEAEGDLETAHNTAPGASLVYVAAASCDPSDILAATNEIVDQHLADIVTNSYTLAFASVPPAVQQAARQTFVQAAIEGIGLFYGSGDLGDVSPFLGTPQTTWPESDPFVTSVGGTSLFIGPDNQREGEVGWGMTFDPVSGAGYQAPVPGTFFLGSGGGITQYPQPFYQRGVVPPALAGTTSPRRVTPDVAAVADLATPVLIGITFNGAFVEAGGGGTSLSSPLFAGIEALADQAAGGPHGFVNPAVYLLRSKGILHDVSNVPDPLAIAFPLNGTTNLDTLQTDTSLVATPGYDDQTGLGSPNGAAYVAALAGH